MSKAGQLFNSLSPETQGRIAILALTLLGWGSHTVVEGKLQHQLDQAHELRLAHLPPHLQEWTDLQARQQVEDAQLEDSVSLARRGFTALRHGAQDLTLAAIHSRDVMKDVDDQSKPRELTREDISFGGGESRR